MTTINIFKNRFTTKAFHVANELDAEAFRREVSNWQYKTVAKKEDAPVFTMCRYGDEPNRKKVNIHEVTGIVLDVDDGNTAKQLVSALEALESYAHCWYPTYSSTEENPRIRIVVPLAASVSPEVFEAEKLALRLAKLLNLTIDDCCEKAAQFYYMPSGSVISEDMIVYVGDSTVLFDINDLPALSTIRPKKKASTSREGQSDIFQATDDLVATMFGGVEPMYVGEKFHVYSNGVWRAVDAGRTFCKAIVQHHKRSVSIAFAMELTSAMKIMFSCDRFPDSAINKITLKNGTLNTDTRELEPHSPDNYHRSGMPFDYDPEAKCHLILKAFNDIFLHDKDKALKIQLLQEWIGYLLTPSTKYHVMLWLFGGGANGKSVITRIVRELLGPENVSSIPLSQLGARFIGAELQGKLANIVDEIATNALMQEDELKKIVSGDPILVERKAKDPYFFSPTARIMAATNTLPPSKDSTHGLDRRLMLLTCNRTFRPDEMDRELHAKLMPELPGFFVWALQGQARLKEQDEFTQPPSSIEALEEFKEGRNSVALFKRDCLDQPKGHLEVAGEHRQKYRVPSHRLYNLYDSYCKANNYQPFGNEIFGRKLKELGVQQIRPGGKRSYVVSFGDLEGAGVAGCINLDEFKESHRNPNLLKEAA